MDGRGSTSRLREARKSARLSQEALARQAGVCQPLVSRLELQGAAPRPPWPDGVERVAAALGTSPDDLFGAEPVAEPVDPWSRAIAMRDAGQEAAA